jgi:hypothetical protein
VKKFCNASGKNLSKSRKKIGSPLEQDLANTEDDEWFLTAVPEGSKWLHRAMMKIDSGLFYS